MRNTRWHIGFHAAADAGSHDAQQVRCPSTSGFCGVFQRRESLDWIGQSGKGLLRGQQPAVRAHRAPHRAWSSRQAHFPLGPSPPDSPPLAPNATDGRSPYLRCGAHEAHCSPAESLSSTKCSQQSIVPTQVLTVMLSSPRAGPTGVAVPPIVASRFWGAPVVASDGAISSPAENAPSDAKSVAIPRPDASNSVIGMRRCNSGAVEAATSTISRPHLCARRHPGDRVTSDSEWARTS